MSVVIDYSVTIHHEYFDKTSIRSIDKTAVQCFHAVKSETVLYHGASEWLRARLFVFNTCEFSYVFIQHDVFLGFILPKLLYSTAISYLYYLFICLLFTAT